jgi:hypothetical protein
MPDSFIYKHNEAESGVIEPDITDYGYPKRECSACAIETNDIHCFSCGKKTTAKYNHIYNDVEDCCDMEYGIS